MTTRWSRGDVPRGDDYDGRFAALAAAGHDVHGEASLVEGLLREHGGRTVLDAGCGTGRVAIELARRGLEVAAVDVDEAMLATARRKAPALTWVSADLTALDLGRRFDLALMAGNVLLFVAPGTEHRVVARVGGHLEPGGLLVSGFRLGSGVSLDDYDGWCAAAGLTPRDRWATWDREPFTGGGYAVSVHLAGDAG